MSRKRIGRLLFAGSLVLSLQVWAGGLIATTIGQLSSVTQSVVQPLLTSDSLDPLSGLIEQSSLDALRHTWVRLQGTNVMNAVGATSYSATITVDGVQREYVVVRPDPAPPSSALLFILHGNGGTAASMANISEVSDYVATQGFWAVLPQGLNDAWLDDPSADSEADVNFISALIDALVNAGGIDPSRVYAAGFSNGGFMTARLACELSDKIAAFGMVSATFRKGLPPNCAPAVQRPKVLILGTSDAIVPYSATLAINSIQSGTAAMSFWSAQQGCSSPSTISLPDSTDDGTTVQLRTYASCSSGADLRLYTVNGGGHAWPGGWVYFPLIGRTSTDIAATGIIWSFAGAYHL